MLPGNGVLADLLAYDPHIINHSAVVDGGRTVSIGGGVRVPYPAPTGAGASASGVGNRRADTKPEMRVRSALHAAGLRYRKDLLIRYEGGRVKPDVVFTRRKVAVFIDGCFWHSCPVHGTSPKSNTSYWGPKLGANVARDRRNDDGLSAAGWLVVRIWEHEDVDEAVARVIEAVTARS